MHKCLENISVMKKVVIPATVVLAAAVGIVALAEHGLGTLTAQTHQIINITAKRQSLAFAMTASANGVAASEKNAMLMTDKAGLDVFASAYVSEIDHLNDDVAQLRDLAADPGEQHRLDDIARAIGAYNGTGQQLYQLMVDRRVDDAHALSIGAAQVAREQLLALIKAEVDKASAVMQSADAAADALYNRTFALLAALSLGGLLLALLVAHWITTRFILQPLTKITDGMSRLSGGDLAIEIGEADRGDEIGVLGRALVVFRERSLALREKTESLETAHNEIQALNAVLERRVEERTAALKEAHRELIVAERLSSLGALTASIAHELRNPLSTLRNTMHCIGQIAQPCGINIVRQIGRCERTIDRCNGIIGDLLDFAEASELHAAPMQVDIWLSETLDRIVLPPAVELERALAAPAVVATIDDKRLACAVANLIDNAVEAMQAADALAERRITVATRAGERVEIVITDTGPGMSAEALARAFEPLYSTHAFGTGLGLPTVKQVVERHGGEVSINSAPGRGTSVVLSLPPQTSDSRRVAA
jgi:signal transduction histidine kinase